MKKPIKLVHLKWLISREVHRNVKCSWKSFFRLANLIYVSIYTLSDLGDLSHLLASGIMCELGVFPIFFRE